MFRFLSILVLAASIRGCVTYEFEHEFWLNTDGSGSFVVTAPPWVWNAVKNVGEARNLDATVTPQSVAVIFNDPAILNARVKKVTRKGQPYITVAADFADSAMPRICSTIFVAESIACTALVTALIAWSTLPLTPVRSDARLVSDRAVKNADASSSALATFKPVDRRPWVRPIRLVVFWRDSRLEREAAPNVMLFEAMKSIPF